MPLIRDSTGDITGLPSSRRALVVAGNTLYIQSGNTLRGYNRTTKARDTSKDISIWTSSTITGSCTDGTTIWLQQGSTVRAYTISTKARDTSKELTTSVSSNTRALFTDGTTLWAARYTSKTIYAYTIGGGRDTAKTIVTAFTDAQLGHSAGYAGFTAAYKASNGILFLAAATGYTGVIVELATDHQTVISATDPTSENIQTEGLAGDGGDLYVLLAGKTAVNLYRRTTVLQGQLSGTLAATGRLVKTAQTIKGSLGGYQWDQTALPSIGNRDSTKEFSIPFWGGACDPIIVGDTIWVPVLSGSQYLLRAYTLSTKARDAAKDINLSTLFSLQGSLVSNDQILASAFDGTTAWFVFGNSSRTINNKVYALNWADKTRNTQREIDLSGLLVGPANFLVTDGVHLWVGADLNQLSVFSVEDGSASGTLKIPVNPLPPVPPSGGLSPAIGAAGIASVTYHNNLFWALGNTSGRLIGGRPGPTYLIEHLVVDKQLPASALHNSNYLWWTLAFSASHVYAITAYVLDDIAYPRAFTTSFGTGTARIATLNAVAGDQALTGSLAGTITYADHKVISRTSHGLSGGLTGTLAATALVSSIANNLDFSGGLTGTLSASARIVLRASAPLSGGLSGTLASTAKLDIPVSLSGAIDGNLAADAEVISITNLDYSGGLTGDLAAASRLSYLVDHAQSGSLSGTLAATAAVVTITLANFQGNLAGVQNTTPRVISRASKTLSGSLGIIHTPVLGVVASVVSKTSYGLSGSLSGTLASNARTALLPTSHDFSGGLTGVLSGPAYVHVRSQAAINGSLSGTLSATGRVQYVGSSLGFSGGLTGVIGISDASLVARTQHTFDGQLYSYHFDVTGRIWVAHADVDASGGLSGSLGSTARLVVLPAEHTLRGRLDGDLAGGGVVVSQATKLMTTNLTGSLASTAIVGFLDLNHGFSGGLSGVLTATDTQINSVARGRLHGLLTGDLQNLAAPVTLSGGLTGVLKDIVLAVVALQGGLTGTLASAAQVGSVRAAENLHGSLDGFQVSTGRIFIAGDASLNGGLSGALTGPAYTASRVNLDLSGGLSGILTSSHRVISQATAELHGQDTFNSFTGYLTATASNYDTFLHMGGDLSGTLSASAQNVLLPRQAIKSMSGGLADRSYLTGVAPIRAVQNVPGSLTGDIGIVDASVGSATSHDLIGGLTGTLASTASIKALVAELSGGLGETRNPLGPIQARANLQYAALVTMAAMEGGLGGSLTSTAQLPAPPLDVAEYLTGGLGGTLLATARVLAPEIPEPDIHPTDTPFIPVPIPIPIPVRRPAPSPFPQATAQKPDLPSVLEYREKQFRKQLQVSLPATIVDYNPATRRATVQPLPQVLRYVGNGQGEDVPRPELPDVPVIFPSSPRAAVLFKVLPGDPVMLLFSQRSLEDFKSKYTKGSLDLTHRVMDPLDAVALYGFGSLETVPADEDAEVTVQTTDGDTYFSLKPNAITIKAANITLEGDVSVKGSSLTHNDTNVGDDHKHSDVDTGPDDTGPPVG